MLVDCSWLAQLQHRHDQLVRLAAAVNREVMLRGVDDDPWPTVEFMKLVDAMDADKAAAVEAKDLLCRMLAQRLDQAWAVADGLAVALDRNTPAYERNRPYPPSTPMAQGHAALEMWSVVRDAQRRRPVQL